MKVTAILKGMIDQNGHQPIQIRISDRGRQTFRPTRIKVAPALFDKGRVKPAHPKAKQYNEDIARLIIQLQAQVLEGLAPREKRIDFYRYVEHTIKHMSRAEGTKRIYTSQLAKLKEFAPRLDLQGIDRDFLTRYRHHLENEREYQGKVGNGPNTVWSSFKFLRRFVRHAYRVDKLIKHNPFDGWESPRQEETTPIYLTEEEVRAMDRVLESGLSGPLITAGTWFLIGCYTGLRVSDILAFEKKNNVVGGRLVIKMKKVGAHVGIPILPKVQKYFERVNYQAPGMHENTYRALIKVVAAAAGIEKRISTHTARHTAAMRLADAGVAREVIAKILGQKDLRSTAVYAKISNQRIDVELRKLE